MSLYGSIKEVQSGIEKLYLKLEQRFNENKLISHLWSQMAQDVSRQIHSLHDLPKSFWSRLKKDQVELIETITAEIKSQSSETEKDLSLSNCIDIAIRSEEVIILKIYVPLIRNLRKNWTGQALEFYIIVKAHIVRIKRIAEAYSGDPVVLQHSTLLFHGFEKEIQEPDIETIQKIKSARRRRRAVKAGKAKPKTKPKVQDRPKPEAKALPKPKVKPKSKAKPKLKVQKKPKPKAKAKPGPMVKPKTRVKPKQKVKPKPKVKPKLKAQTKPKPKTQSKPKQKVRPKSKTSAKAKPKAASKSQKIMKQSRSPISRSKLHRSRSKPLVKKADIRRRRARR